jgi:hypothetical protein
MGGGGGVLVVAVVLVAVLCEQQDGTSRRCVSISLSGNVVHRRWRVVQLHALPVMFLALSVPLREIQQQ